MRSREEFHAALTYATLTYAIGTAEREATVTMLDHRKGRRRSTLAADKAHDIESW